MSYITALGTANPLHRFSQSQIADFMEKAMALSTEEAEQLKILYRASGIETRYSVLPDYGKKDKYEFYSNSNSMEPFPSTKDRLNIFRKESVDLSHSAANDCLNGIPDFNTKEITHVIAVSCTGMFAPGLDIELINRLKLNSTVSRTSINFMGCYAAFNALRLADSFCAQSINAKVLIVCIELCSIHFQKENTEDNKLANALFADGAAAILVESKMRIGINLEIGSFFCDVAMEGERDMSWSVGDQGFEMKLSAYVPEVIRNGIRKLTSSLLSVNKIQLSEIAYYAIHPGGKKILEAIEEELGLSKVDNSFSYHVMRNYGNMSSPTVIFVLNEILTNLTEDDENKKILSFGFGPGLTLESLILTIKKL